MPPVWLAGFLGLAWTQAQVLPLGLGLGTGWVRALGGGLAGGGLLLIVLAAVEMARHRTTIIPGNTARTLVQSGIFGLSRNPIYLGDALILTGLILYWGAVPSLVLVPIFVRVIQTRFIRPEEHHLRGKFPDSFARYCQNTRRWV